MNRILFEREEIGADGTARLAPDDVRAVHVRTVLKAEAGCPLKTGVVDGPAGVSRILSVSPEGAVAIQTSHGDEAPAPWFDLLLAMPRPRSYKRLLPQITAMGARRIALVWAEKTEKAYWGAKIVDPGVARPYMVEGLMQSGATVLPLISAHRDFAAFARSGALARMFEGQPARFAAHPSRDPGADLRAAAGTVPVLAIGPEGGWTDAELGMLEKESFARISLGPRILRSDTAAIALAAAVAAARALA